jgi:hypothetical protein
MATKQDIKSITNKIEEIKFEYSKKLEEYKTELTKKYEFDKILIEIKTDIFQETRDLKAIIFRVQNKIGKEKEQMETIFSLITEISIQVHSLSFFNENIKGFATQLTNEYNKLVVLIKESISSREMKIIYDFNKIKSIIDNLQIEIIK